MKIILTILGLLNGVYMLVDGVFVMINGKYIGSAKPGPWAYLFYKLKVDVFSLGPLFIITGFLWLIWLYAIWANQSWASWFGILVSIGTLWYLPIGTILSIAVFVIILLRG